ncbi:hypothetical protein ABIA39_007366 [Nocardia sp. GAS34]
MAGSGISRSAGNWRSGATGPDFTVTSGFGLGHLAALCEPQRSPRLSRRCATS